MNSVGCDYLDQSLLRVTPRLLEFAVDAVIDAALGSSATYRLVFDRLSLASILGAQTMAILLPGPASRPDATGGSEQQDQPLDQERAALLRQVMSFGPSDWAEPPITAVYRLVLFDRSGSVVLRAGDGGDELLFDLPVQDRAKLLSRLNAGGVPGDAVQTVAVDITQNV